MLFINFYRAACNTDAV